MEKNIRINGKFIRNQICISYFASISILANNSVQHCIGNTLLHYTIMVIMMGMGAHSWIGIMSHVGVCGGSIFFHFSTGQNQWSCSVRLEKEKNSKIVITTTSYSYRKSLYLNIYTFLLKYPANISILIVYFLKYLYLLKYYL